MKKYVVITENDVSEWNDETGARYHFPNRYKNILTPGTSILYYKGRLNDKTFKAFRLMNEPHYFGYGIIGNVYVDNENSKNFYAEIEDYTPFATGVYFKKNNNSYYEDVSKSKYWRDGVRNVNAKVFNDILIAANVPINTNETIIAGETKIELTKDSIIKYKGSNNNKSTNYTPNNIKKIGDKGEQLVLSYLKDSLHINELKTLRWLANEGETPGYDIEYFNLNQQKVCIEVKSTTAKKFPYFHLTINEYNAAQQNELYFVYLVSNCQSNKPKIEILDNPFIKDNFKLEPIVFKVYQLEDK